MHFLLFKILTFNSIFLQTDTGETFMESLLNGLQQHYTQFESQNTNSTSSTITSMYPECYVVLMCELYPHVSQNLEKPFSIVEYSFNLRKKKFLFYKLDLLISFCYNYVVQSHTLRTRVNDIMNEEKLRLILFKKEEGVKLEIRRISFLTKIFFKNVI